MQNGGLNAVTAARAPLRPGPPPDHASRRHVGAGLSGDGAGAVAGQGDRADAVDGQEGGVGALGDDAGMPCGFSPKDFK